MYIYIHTHTSNTYSNTPILIMFLSFTPMPCFNEILQENKDHINGPEVHYLYIFAC